MHTRLRALLLLFLAAPLFPSDTLTKSLVVDFFREVPSRNLQGFAARSDGRLVAGPALRELKGDLPSDLLWTAIPGWTPGLWYAGTGPDGRILELTVDAAQGRFEASTWARLDDSQVYALCRLPDGMLLAGTSPRGTLNLLRAGKLIARSSLPADSVLDLLALDKTGAAVLAATGNPGRIYRIDIERFAASGDTLAKLGPPETLANRGITLFGELRDRNVRRLALLPDGRVLAGSAPKGNIYAFPESGGAPVILMENKDAEVTDFQVQPDGSFHASVVASPASGEQRILRQGKGALPPPAGAASSQNAPAPQPAPGLPQPPQGGAAAQEASPAFSGSESLSTPEKFGGRSFLVYFPKASGPEIVANRANQSFFRLARRGDWLLIAGGEQGDLLGYDVPQRLSLTFPGSGSAQLSGIEPVPGSQDVFLVLRNNPAGFSLLDFSGSTPRSAETRRLDLGLAGTLGALRFPRLHGTGTPQLRLEARVSYGTEEGEGWSSWLPLDPLGDTGTVNIGWRSQMALRGRYAKLRLTLPAGGPADIVIDHPVWLHLPQNRRPVLSEFRILSPEYGIIPAAEPQTSPVATLNQVINAASQASSDGAAEKKRSAFLNSQIVPDPGRQVIFWSVSDPDGDSLVSNLSLRHEEDAAWIPVAVDSRDSFAQINTTLLREGLYHTRLVVREEAPRPAADRLEVVFDTDDLVVDRTPPAILDASARVVGGMLVVTVHGRDNLAVLLGLEVELNQGWRASTEQPVDGIRDSREETFSLEIPLARAAGATQLEASLYDAHGNRSTRVLRW